MLASAVGALLLFIVTSVWNHNELPFREGKDRGIEAQSVPVAKNVGVQQTALESNGDQPVFEIVGKFIRGVKLGLENKDSISAIRTVILFARNLGLPQNCSFFFTRYDSLCPDFKCGRLPCVLKIRSENNLLPEEIYSESIGENISAQLALGGVFREPQAS